MSGLELLVSMLVSALAGGSALWASMLNGRVQLWKAAAAGCGLGWVGTSLHGWAQVKLTARAGPQEVRFESRRHPANGSRVVVVVAPWPPGFHRLKIRREPLVPTKAPEIEVGHELFDGTFLVEGPMRLACSLLDAETCRLLVRANAECRLEIMNGELRAEMPDERVREALPLLLEIGRRLAQPFEPAERLAANALGHPSAEVRLRNLILLVRECTWDARTVEALRNACSDASPEIRLRAAIELGVEGRNVLVELAEGNADDEVSAEAVASLGRELPFERLEALHTRSLPGGRRKTAAACLGVLGKWGDAALEVLARAMASEERELVIAAAEPALIEALKRERPDLWLPAASALRQAEAGQLSLAVEIWQKAAAACALEGVEITGLWEDGLELRARAGSLRVRLERIKVPWPSPKRARIVLAVPGPPGVSDVRIHAQTVNSMRESAVRLEAPSLLGQLLEVFTESSVPIELPDFELGDRSFDAAFSIGGQTRILCMLLDAKTRRLMVQLSTACRLEIEAGEIEAEVEDAQLHEVLPQLLDLGRRLAQPIDDAQRLAENVLHDPEPAVRLCNLTVLVRTCTRDAEMEETLRKACSDRNPEIRLRAALELASQDKELLVRELAGGMADDTLSAQAAARWGEDLPFEAMANLLKVSLRRRRTNTAYACVVALGRWGKAAVEPLAKVMATEEGELAVAAVRALSRIGTPAETPLIAALKREMTDLRFPAACALGSVGTAAAILPLREAAERPASPDVRQAIDQAIAGIQSRLPGAAPGQLSLAAPEAGQLSLAQAEAGQLSLADDPAGQLSLAAGELHQGPKGPKGLKGH